MDLKIDISKEAKREEKYLSLLPQLDALYAAESDFIANLANTSSVLQDTFGFLWTGFYLWKENELVLGPFQGPIACTRIQSGRGVCGTSFQEMKTIIVGNVDDFPGHIVCSPLSKSEIVLPLMVENKAIGVLDIDSQELNFFDELDQKYLEEIIVKLLKYSKL